MTEDTRDIAIRTATKVEAVEKKLDAALAALEEMRAENSERRGAERVARWIIGVSSGVLGGGTGAAALAKFGTFFAQAPLPK